MEQIGYGKDLDPYSFDDYANVKHVYVDLTGRVRKPYYHTAYGNLPENSDADESARRDLF